MVAERVWLCRIQELDPDGYEFRVLAQVAARYDLPVNEVASMLVYRLESEDEVYDEFEFWDHRGVIVNDKVFSRTWRKE